MRIIHTGDWHMNHRLGRKDLTGYIEDAIRQIADYLKEKEADVLLVAGDLFSGRESRDQLRDSMRFLKQTFEGFLKGGGMIVAISGNHDNDNFFLTLQDAFEMVLPVQESQGVHAPGRLYLAPKPDLLKLRGRSGQIVQFVLLPYPIPTAYLPKDKTNFTDPAQRAQAMTEVLRQTLNAQVTQLDHKLPSVLVSHLQIEGVTETDLYRPQGVEVVLAPGEIRKGFAYGAFGHIHRPGSLPGIPEFRYCGSLLPLDAGEAGQGKSVTYLEIGQGGLAATPQQLAISGPPLLDIIIDACEIDSLREKYPQCETALVKYTLRFCVEEYPDPTLLHERIQNIFLHWYENGIEALRREDPIHSGGQGGERQPLDFGNIEGNVSRYLMDHATYADDDGEKAQVLALANGLLARGCLVGKVTNKELSPEQLERNEILITDLMEVRI